MPNDLDELLAVLGNLPDGTKYRLVGGNTGTGIFDADGPYDVFIDVKKVAELKETSKSPVLEVGGGVVLSDWMDLMKSVASENPAYKYGNVIHDHLMVVSTCRCSIQ